MVVRGLEDGARRGGDASSSTRDARSAVYKPAIQILPRVYDNSPRSAARPATKGLGAPSRRASGCNGSPGLAPISPKALLLQTTPERTRIDSKKRPKCYCDGRYLKHHARLKYDRAE
jgi:hypothetical protein